MLLNVNGLNTTVEREKSNNQSEKKLDVACLNLSQKEHDVRTQVQEKNKTHLT